MKERSIRLKAHEVRGVLDGTKTQTRWVLKQATGPSLCVGIADDAPGVANLSWLYGNGPGHEVYEAIKRVPCPYGKPGDRLWVREKFQPLLADGVEHWRADWETGKGYAISYPATDGIKEWIDADDNIGSGCKPSIHMPRWASRITLEITGVRVERLNDISEADAVAEGVFRKVGSTPIGDAVETATGGELIYALPTQAREEYRSLWESINGHGSWNANPWVWVVEFKRV